MRIIYLGAFRLPNGDAAASRVLNNAKALREGGHSIRFISWGGKYPDHLKGNDGLYRIDGFVYIITEELDALGMFWNKLKTRIYRGKKTLAILNSEFESTDVVISYNPTFRLNWLLIHFCKKHRLKYVNDITEWSARNELYLTEILPNYLNLCFLTKKVKNKIVISDFLKNYYINSNNVVVPPLCDTKDKKWSIKIDNLEKNPFVGITLIYAGYPAKKDCLHIAINVVQKLLDDGENIRFIILGISKDKYFSNYGYLLNTSELNDNIIFMGRVTQDIIPGYYYKSDFMVLLRKTNRKSTAGFPTKFVESMVSGTPIIANYSSDLRKYLFDGINGFVLDNPNETSLLNVLKYKILNLTKGQIEKMKTRTAELGSCFDYHNKVLDFTNFIDKLK